MTDKLKNKNMTNKLKMTEKEAIINLAYHNDWRLGEDILMLEPKVITESIKVVIQQFKKRTKEQQLIKITEDQKKLKLQAELMDAYSAVDNVYSSAVSYAASVTHCADIGKKPNNNI